MKPLVKLRPLALAVYCALLTLLEGAASADETQSESVTTSASAAVVIDMETGRVLLSYHENEPLPMASTTKVMTALLALENGNLDDVVTVSQNAYGVPGTSIYLSLGEHIRLRDLLYGLLLASGNDAAVAIAEHIGGDVETFCRMMNQRAQELGCQDTVFVNPNGLPADGHHTTALDLALIAREAMSHELFREIVSTQRATIPWEGRSYDRVLNNKNRLLSDYEGALQTLKAAIPKGSLPSLELDLPDQLDAGLPRGQEVGEARLTLNGETLAVTPLVVSETLGVRDYGYELDRLWRCWPMNGQEIAQ